MSEKINIGLVGQGKVFLIAGGGKCYTDIAARFTSSERNAEEIISSDYNPNIIKAILDSGHLAATEFDMFIFGIEGYARVTEVQLVRKRLASYLIKSGRNEKGGKRSYDIVMPPKVMNCKELVIKDKNGNDMTLTDYLEYGKAFYDKGLELGLKEEELRYFKPQATEFKAIIAMNAHSLLDWFKIRTCLCAQTEIRDLANKMMKLCKKANPDLFQYAGPSCVALGYCPENSRMHEACKKAGKYKTKDEALKILGVPTNTDLPEAS